MLHAPRCPSPPWPATRCVVRCLVFTTRYRGAGHASTQHAVVERRRAPSRASSARQKKLASLPLASAVRRDPTDLVGRPPTTAGATGGFDRISASYLSTA